MWGSGVKADEGCARTHTQAARVLTTIATPACLHPLLPQASAAEESVGILERNMSALFNTARLDLARKELETKALTAACVVAVGIVARHGGRL